MDISLCSIVNLIEFSYDIWTLACYDGFDSICANYLSTVVYIIDGRLLHSDWLLLLLKWGLSTQREWKRLHLGADLCQGLRLSAGVRTSGDIAVHDTCPRQLILNGMTPTTALR